MYIIIILLTYLFNVGIVNLIQFLINLTFNTNFNYNVWLLGLLFLIIGRMLKGNNNNQKKDYLEL